MNKLGVLELQANQINDAICKNSFIAQCQRDYLAIADSSKISREQLEHLLEAEDMFAFGDVFALCAGAEQDAILVTLEDVVECFAVQIIALVFRRDLLSVSGCYNYRLHGLTDYEMLCRLTEANKNAILVFPGIQEDVLELGIEDAYTCAYMVRKYLKEFQAWGKAEIILKLLYTAMEQCAVLDEFKQYLTLFLEKEEAYNHIAITTAPIVILRGDDTCFGVLQDFAESLATVFKQMGQACILAGDGQTDYDFIMSHVNKAIIGFQSKAFRIDFFKKLQGPKFQFWFDNPIMYEDYFSDLSDDCNVLCHDANYVEVIRERYHHKNTLLLPPAGHKVSEMADGERPYDIVFIGKYIPESGEQFAGLDRELYEYMLDNPEDTIVDGIKAVMERNGLPDSRRKVSDTFVKIKQVYQNIICCYRNKVIESILAAGYEVHVYGDSWDMYESPYTHKMIRHPAVTVNESVKEWQKAKIGLNIMSWHKAGMTERIANIMLSGAACLSEETSYLKEHFVEGKDIVTFRLSRLEELPYQIEQLLQDDNWRKVAHNGYEIASCEHTWEKRALQLLEIIEEII